MNGQCGSISLRVVRLAAVLLLLGLMATSASALPVYQFGNGGISFGVAGYGGGPNNGAPTYIANNITGRVDILTSPAGGFQTANPIVANNIASYAFPAFPAAAFQVGGGNVNGAFGQGQMLETGKAYGFALRDTFPGAGSASYEIGSMISTFNNPAVYNGPWGGYLAIGGRLPAINAAGVVALRSFVHSNIPGSPFCLGGAGCPLGVEMPQLVLAVNRNPGNLYSGNALGGPGGNTAKIKIDNAALGLFRGLAVNNLGNIIIPAGDQFTVTSTLTAYADPDDPMDLDMLGKNDVSDLLSELDTSIPQLVFQDNVTVPEPGTWFLLAVGGALVVAAKRRAQ